jgi:DNA/RNA endonuclease G (NUC1)
MNGLFKVSDKTYTLSNLHPQHWEENEKSIIVLFI